MPTAAPCGACLKSPPSFEGAIALFEYRFPLDALLRRFKYGGDLAIGRWLATRFAHRLREAPRPSALVAPPSSAERLRMRGFNPALEIAKEVASGLGIPCWREAIVRTRPTLPQPALRRGDRERNLRAAFACRRELHGAHVAIVDDVLTTGATANAAAQALRRAGAGRVDVWALARTPLDALRAAGEAPDV